MQTKISVLFAALLLSQMQLSAEQRAHEHGAAEAQMVLENEALEIIIHLPGADFIGFEYSETTDREKESIQERISDIESNSDKLITFKTSKGMLVLLQETHAGLMDEHDGLNEDNGHDEHHHHSDYEIHLHYQLENRENLKQINFETLFNEFPSLTKIRWVIIGSNGQSAGTLTPSNNTIRL